MNIFNIFNRREKPVTTPQFPAQQLETKAPTTLPGKQSTILAEVKKAEPLADTLHDPQYKPVRCIMASLLEGSISKEEATASLKYLKTALSADNQQSAADLCNAILELMGTENFSYFKSRGGVTVLAAINPSEVHKYILASDSEGNSYLAIQPLQWGEHRTILKKMEEITGKELECNGRRYSVTHLLDSYDTDKFNGWLSKLTGVQREKVSNMAPSIPLLIETEGAFFLALVLSGSIRRGASYEVRKTTYVGSLDSPKTGGGAIKILGPESGSLSGAILVHDYSGKLSQGPNELVGGILREKIFAGEKILVGLPMVLYHSSSELPFSRCELV